MAWALEGGIKPSVEPVLDDGVKRRWRGGTVTQPVSGRNRDLAPVDRGS
jgi:hypothetical protein